jgi:uncharacterized membrane protein YvlD (DUF360 family)
VIRFLIRTAIFFASALIGLWVADLLLPDMTLDGKSYFLVAIIFALIQAILSPLIMKTVHRNASAFTGGVGIISTLVALLITSLLLGGLDIDGITTWVLAALIVWLAGAIAAFILPMILVKKAVDERRD